MPTQGPSLGAEPDALELPRLSSPHRPFTVLPRASPIPPVRAWTAMSPKICNTQLLVDLSMGSLFFLILSSSFCDADARFHQHIWVDNGIKRGYFSKAEMCPRGHAHGFSLKIHEYQGSLLWQDDTSLNGIRLYCSDGKIIESNVGRHGYWSLQQYCYGGNLNAFRLRVDPLRGWGMMYDDTTVSNVEFKCETGEILTGNGHEWGIFGAWSTCYSGSICGLQTRVEGPKGVTDELALNDVIFLCCPYDR
ncbi:hypothetical protein lerEdw1_014908 [Lerista edwardsae]|nr:hypothetical protein lerEdw1_014909 [Lerista edwardsae]KAJ6620406.1 hypothetical protein lerEdw1_014908 [Lerista edwardsae]